MRVLTVSEIKGGWRSHCVQRDYPAPGTAADQVYRRLVADKGRAVFVGDITAAYRFKRAIADLMDFYGLDIRKGPRRGWYILAGEWFGSHYSDYVVQAIDAAVAARRAA